VGVQVGTAIVATRYVIDQINPASLAMLRYAIGFLCLLPPALMAQRVPFKRADLLPVSFLGITQFGLVVALLNVALQSVPSARVALIFATFPLLTMLIAALLGYEHLTLPKSLGVGLSIVGVGFALSGEVFQAGETRSWTGEFAALASALAGAVCSVLYRPYLRRYPTLQLSSVAMLASVGFLALLAAGEGFFSTPLRVTTGGWLAILFIGVSSGLGYYLWLWALGRATPTRVTVFLALSPITATGLGALFLEEWVTPTLLIGVACTALGLGLACHVAERDSVETADQPGR
jgi:drug/metabolite transporter (DMT)-like permease